MATLVANKKKTVRINGCVAAAQAAKYADVDVITAYPIRPYTATMMALAQMVANGELDAEYIVAEARETGTVGLYRNSGEVREGLVQEILTKVPAEKILWEAPQKDQQLYFLTLIGAFQTNSLVALFATTGVILSAAYALYLYRRVIFGALVKPALMTIQDLSVREIVTLAPLVAITIAIGVYPKPIFDVTSVSVANLVEQSATASREDQKQLADNSATQSSSHSSSPASCGRPNFRIEVGCPDLPGNDERLVGLKHVSDSGYSAARAEMAR